MKIAIVPAQVTTIEDKVAGSLNLSQLILLVMPVFVGGVIYAVMPPSFAMAIYKMISIGLLFIVVASLAIKIRGRMVLGWIVILARYNTRPRFYIFNKNSSYLRVIDVEPAPKQIKIKTSNSTLSNAKQLPRMDIGDKARFEALLADPNSKLSFKTSRKGGLDVYITEVK